MAWVIARLSEPSTHAGLAAIAASVASSTAPGLVHQLALLAVALLGSTAIAKAECSRC
jgi:hypothetical protein